MAKKKQPDNVTEAKEQVGSDSSRCYAFLELDGTIDLDSISESVDGVRWRVLENSMGWRFEHPDHYNHDEEWKRLLTFGRVAPVAVWVMDADTGDLHPRVTCSDCLVECHQVRPGKWQCPKCE